MDTISRENNSMLPVGAIIVGVIALLLGGYAAITVSKVNKTVTDHNLKMGKIETVESTANSAASTADRAAKDLQKLAKETQGGFDQVSAAVIDLRSTVLKLEDASKKPAAPVAKEKKGSGEPPVPGPGEYVVKPGDNGTKVASANGVSLGDLQAVNPGVNLASLKIGQKLKLPKK
jgi:LysM repeat protein